MVYDPVSKRYYASTTSEGKAINKVVCQMKEIKKEETKKHKRDKLVQNSEIILKLYRKCLYHQCGPLYSPSIKYLEALFDIIIDKVHDPYKFEVFDMKDDIILGIENKHSPLRCSLANVNRVPVIKHGDFSEEEIVGLGKYLVDVRDMIIIKRLPNGNLQIAVATSLFIYIVSLDASYTVQDGIKYKFSTSHCDRVKLYQFKEGLIIVTMDAVYSLVDGHVNTLVSHINDVKNINICPSTYNNSIIIYTYDANKKLSVRDYDINRGIKIINVEQSCYGDSIISLTHLLSPLAGMYVGFDRYNIVIQTQKHIERKRLPFVLDYGSRYLFTHNIDSGYFILYSPKKGVYRIYFK